MAHTAVAALIMRLTQSARILGEIIWSAADRDDGAAPGGERAAIVQAEVSLDAQKEQAVALLERLAAVLPDMPGALPPCSSTRAVSGHTA
jgi:hypothetical protein